MNPTPDDGTRPLPQTLRLCPKRHRPTVHPTATSEFAAWPFFIGVEGKAVMIAVGGDLVSRLGPYDATRLQVALGKTDRVEIETETRGTYLSFIARQMRIVAREDHGIQARVTVVTLYKP